MLVLTPDDVDYGDNAGNAAAGEVAAAIDDGCDDNRVSDAGGGDCGRAEDAATFPLSVRMRIG